MQSKITVNLPYHVIFKILPNYPDSNIKIEYFTLLHRAISTAYVSSFLSKSGLHSQIQWQNKTALHTFSPSSTCLVNVIYFFSPLIFASQVLVGNLESLLFCSIAWLGKCCLKQKLLIIVIIILILEMRKLWNIKIR